MKKRFKILVYILCSILLMQSFPSLLITSSATIAGDVNCDGTVTAADARKILRRSVGNTPEAGDDRKAADVNSDGYINANDARLALRLAIGLSGNSSRMVGAKLIGFTSKDYPIYEKDGKTYIDGVLIANKSYSLPESYNPNGLTDECLEAFGRMQKAAASRGLSIYISSGFRSYSSQKSIYNRYVNRDGRAAADTYSARPGHSEHQTGLSIDLNTITQSFGNTAEGKWVAAHCHEYGFILRYPKGKSHITGYCFEPWHFRYVGVDTATKIMNSGLCLEEYYGITSCYS